MLDVGLSILAFAVLIVMVILLAAYFRFKDYRKYIMSFNYLALGIISALKVTAIVTGTTTSTSTMVDYSFAVIAAYTFIMLAFSVWAPNEH